MGDEYRVYGAASSDETLSTIRERTKVEDEECMNINQKKTLFHGRDIGDRRYGPRCHGELQTAMWGFPAFCQPCPPSHGVVSSALEKNMGSQRLGVLREKYLLRG
jgi:hypothetical protein